MQIQPIVVGTAGHIDHGKSTLVQALTGVDPDRWKEEKERGMTIDLGFARFDLPDGRRIGIVDVPGHERLVRNMVAGATGIDLVMLVVAADDGVMPQTREHLSILELLGVQRGMVVITKIDLVDGDLLELVQLDVEETVQGTFLEGAPILPYSAMTKEGFSELQTALVAEAAKVPPHDSEGIFRMPIQRVFSARGFGTIVTGIPVAGSVSVGDVLEVLPIQSKGKVRGLQAYHDTVEVAQAGHSTAINLSDVDRHKVSRGMVVAQPGFFGAVRWVGARLKAVQHLPLPIQNRMQIRLHTGTAEVLGEVILLDSETMQAGEEGFVQLRLSEPLVCAPGDRFVLRLASPMFTLGGGVILDESRFRLKRFKSFVIDDLLRREQSLDSEPDLLESILISSPEGWMETAEVARAMKLLNERAKELLEQLQSEDRVVLLGSQHWMAAESLTNYSLEIRRHIATWFKGNAHRARMDIRDLRSLGFCFSGTVGCHLPGPRKRRRAGTPDRWVLDPTQPPAKIGRQAAGHCGQIECSIRASQIPTAGFGGDRGPASGILCGAAVRGGVPVRHPSAVAHRWGPIYGLRQHANPARAGDRKLHPERRAAARGVARWAGYHAEIFDPHVGGPGCGGFDPT